MHQALPEVDLAAIDATVTLFGKLLAAPILDLVDDRRHRRGQAHQLYPG